jgi:hypothetical protein
MGQHRVNMMHGNGRNSALVEAGGSCRLAAET